jgi:hypothetical protein
MKRQLMINPQPVHWWFLLIAVLFGLVVFFAFHLHAY